MRSGEEKRGTQGRRIQGLVHLVPPSSLPAPIRAPIPVPVPVGTITRVPTYLFDFQILDYFIFSHRFSCFQILRKSHFICVKYHQGGVGPAAAAIHDKTAQSSLVPSRLYSDN